jgi:hypothetical protein
MKPTAILGPSKQRGRKTLEVRLNDINDIIQAKQRIAEAERAIMAKQRAEARARTAQVEGLIGAACRADNSTHAAVKAALDKQVLDPKLRAFLKAEGWLDASAPARVKGAENE